MEKFLIVGLGNIGQEYAGTRHNIGFDILDALAGRHNVQFQVDRLADRTEIGLKGRKLICGKAVKYWMEKENVDLNHLLVLVDELAVPLNKIKMKPAGSDGGHNGLKSIQEILGTTSYPRLRFGIGSDFPRGRQVDYVLGKWRAEELDIVKRKVDRSSKAVEEFALQGLDKTMAEINAIEF
jgi:PTH1 family peptidyl-tRNA hydrolase